MPNFDTGHYFLTTLAPIRNGTTLDDRGVCVSYQQKVRTQLALLPTALQSPATEKIGINSPFADDPHTHLCRFVVLDDVIYNGRQSTDAIANAISGNDPITPQEVDRLSSAYLMFAADIDAVTEVGDTLPATLSEARQDAVRDAYARRLWHAMEEELREIYGNCFGFEEVRDADGFADYLRKCQVETTMPFNDYWLRAPKLKRLSVKGIAALIGVPALVTILGLAAWVFDLSGIPILGSLLSRAPGWICLGGLLATLLAIWIAYRYALRAGNRPMPPGEYADLPSVLKALYLQQAFSEFTIGAQGAGDAELHAAFGQFLEEHKPDDRMTPSQPAGVISMRRAKAVIG